MRWELTVHLETNMSQYLRCTIINLTRVQAMLLLCIPLSNDVSLMNVGTHIIEANLPIQTVHYSAS